MSATTADCPSVAVTMMRDFFDGVFGTGDDIKIYEGPLPLAASSDAGTSTSTYTSRRLRSVPGVRQASNFVGLQNQ